MTVKAPVRRPSVAARRVGYVIAAALTAGCWYLVNVRPGWRALPFLTQDFDQVLALFNGSLVVGLIANLLYVAYDGPRWKAFGDLVTTGIGVAVLVRIWRVFPFAFTGSFSWPPLVRVLLVLAIVGSIVAVVVNLLTLLGVAARPGRSGTAPRRTP